jgi:hypothetical protein
VQALLSKDKSIDASLQRIEELGAEKGRRNEIGGGGGGEGRDSDCKISQR